MARLNNYGCHGLDLVTQGIVLLTHDAISLLELRHNNINVDKLALDVLVDVILVCGLKGPLLVRNWDPSLGHRFDMRWSGFVVVVLLTVSQVVLLMAPLRSSVSGIDSLEPSRRINETFVIFHYFK